MMGIPTNGSAWLIGEKLSHSKLLSKRNNFYIQSSSMGKYCCWHYQLYEYQNIVIDSLSTMGQVLAPCSANFIWM
jgi:hypothetical protein